MQSTFWIHPTVRGGHDGPMRGKWPISQPFVVRFSKIFCLVEAFENPQLHKRLSIVHRLAARGRRSDEGQSRQFFHPRKSKIFNF